MSSRLNWSPADSTALAWLTSNAVDGGATGYDVGPMPDRVFVLHPLTERVDGAKTNDGYREDRDRWPEGSGPEPVTRTLRWAEYAQRRGIPMLVPPYRPGINAALPGVWQDDYVTAPAEGDLGDPPTRDALLAVLTRHTADGGAQQCTALYYDFWLRGHPSADMPAQPHILRGSLGTSQELFDRSNYVHSPVNIWPDDHSWVLYTDEDAWATTISGSPDLINDLLDCPLLESIRIPELA